eukprot:TRINITY_DN2192_c0_g1_i1.p2 TRINITY_DN2192_c0_g1~~TRINITY_DN2192_c0_g1_i1.p2  ORF type:complete len:161 (-),score=8.67 TRINITY_DN2192_c0_g1_i1:713-1195(-)
MRSVWLCGSIFSRDDDDGLVHGFAGAVCLPSRISHRWISQEDQWRRGGPGLFVIYAGGVGTVRCLRSSMSTQSVLRVDHGSWLLAASSPTMSRVMVVEASSARHDDFRERLGSLFYVFMDCAGLLRLWSSLSMVVVLLWPLAVSSPTMSSALVVCASCAH